MSVVSLVSGGLDSTVMATLIAEQGLQQFPLFIDYGQLGRDRELAACRRNFEQHFLPVPKIANLSGIGSLISCGLTDQKRHIVNEAFLPCRNLFFLTTAASYGYQMGADTIAIGLLDESLRLFPDQSRAFLDQAQALLSHAVGRTITIIAPLMGCQKRDVVAIAKRLGVQDTYSCHAGSPEPCGECIACREYFGLEN